MIVKSRIKQIFDDELLKLIGAICDTKRIQSSQKKMKILRDLLYTYHIKFELLGGATNRIALLIDGYAVKFAMDTQGYKDNLVEFSLSSELQPYVTKTYETNGYILVAECVRLMSLEEFHARKMDIIKILEDLSHDHLLGDVGFLEKNMTNWGVRDDGQCVILDYAYCHRATENLFTCNVCGGVLAYDQSYDHLMCRNRTVCTAKYTYNERKQIQGDQVDWDMIAEVKKDSIRIGPGETDYIVGDDLISDGKIIGNNTLVVRTESDITKFMEESNMISSSYDQQEELSRLTELASKLANNDTSVKIEEMGKAYEEIIEDDSQVPNVIYSKDYMERQEERRAEEIEHAAQLQREFSDSDDPDYVEPVSMDELFARLGAAQMEEEPEYEEEPEQVDYVPDKYRNEGTTKVMEEVIHTETTATVRTEVPTEQPEPTESEDKVYVDGEQV